MFTQKKLFNSSEPVINEGPAFLSITYLKDPYMELNSRFMHVIMVLVFFFCGLAFSYKHIQKILG